MLVTPTIAYTTIWGGNYLAIISDGKITHVPDGDWSRAFTSDRIDYVTSAGDRYVATFENGQFRHAPNGDYTQAHTSKYLDYQDWDGQSHFAMLDGNLFTMSSPQGDINNNNYHAIYGTGGNDTIQGSASNDYIDAGAGDDLIWNLGEGDDVVIAGAGNDGIFMNNNSDNNVIIAGAGDDQIFGDGDNNVIIAGAGDDLISFFDSGTNTLTGGEGADEYSFNRISASDSTTITDFWGNDKLTLSNSFLNPDFTHIADLQNGKNIAVNETFNLGSRSGFRYLQSTGQLFYDSDGGDFSSGDLLIATLTNKPIIETFNHTGIHVTSPTSF